MSYLQNKIHHSVLIFLLILVQYNPIIAQDSINLLDKNGRFHGKYKKFHSNGNLRYTGQFEHGKEVGIFKFYALTGEKNPIVIKEYFPKNDSVWFVFILFPEIWKVKVKCLKKIERVFGNIIFPMAKL